ncbi:hypothetical protein [Selenomonas sp.]|uniref:hypothetical protein n=1 Tax=Selenomonas sp. TaxID=2053611 RepID=UPI0026002546|nr:hypothetical protein [Selenomonas sp.]
MYRRQSVVVVRVAMNGARGANGRTQAAVIAFSGVNFPVLYRLFGADGFAVAAGHVGIVKQAAVQVDFTLGHGFSHLSSIRIDAM